MSIHDIGFMTPPESDALRDRLEAAHEFRLARQQVVRLLCELPLEDAPWRRAYGGLAMRVARLRIDAPSVIPPRGWTQRREEYRGSTLVLPMWLNAALALWDYRWQPVAWLLRLGVLQLAEGDYYRNARPCAPHWLRAAVWCFLNDRDTHPIASR